MYKLPNSRLGFTLLELIVVIAIASILLGIAIPSFTSIIRSTRLTTYTNDFVTALNLARSEAIKRGVSVTVRKLGSNWENGWNVFADSNSDGVFDSSEVLIRTYSSLQSTFYTLRGDSNFTDFIRYKSDGSSNNLNVGGFVLCDNRDGNNIPEANTAKLLTVNLAGRVHIGNDSDKDGIPEKENGTEITSCITSPF